MADDSIAMRVPATATSSPLIRLAAAQLAAQRGFDLDRVEDVRMAVNESIRMLIGPSWGGASGPVAEPPHVEAVFTTGDTGLTVALGLIGDHHPATPDDDSVRILAATTSSYRVGPGGVAGSAGPPDPNPREITVWFTDERDKGATG